MSEWRRVPAGRVATQRKDLVQLQDGVEYTTMGVRWYGRGAYDRGVVTTETVKAKTLFRATAGDFVFNRIDTQKGAFDVVPPGLDGALATNEFPLYLTDPEELDARFLRLYFQQAEVLRQIDALRAGSEGRSRWKEADFEGWLIPLPPLAEQRRIVDVMAAVDAEIEALTREVAEARRLLALLNTALLAELPTTRILGEFTTTRSGPSFAAAASSDTVSVGSVPAIGIPNTKGDGSIDLSSVNHVVGLPATVGRIDESSLVLIRTNGNRQRIGNVYLPGPDAHGHIVSAFQFLLKVDDPALREFTYWALREPSMQAAMSNSASGTTGLGNMAVKWLNSARVHWSNEDAEREAAIAPLRAQNDVVQSLDAELASHQMLRNVLLASLLNQDIEIPESYDAVLDSVGAS